MFEQLMQVARIDLSPRHEQPSWARLALASILAVFGSLLVDMALVGLGKAVFPSTKHFGHFQFSDYGKLTVIGVVVACVAWPVVTRVTNSPRWMFFRMAVLVTLVLWLPDLYILWKGESSKGVAVLFVMHLAIAIVTYNCLVHVARVGDERLEGAPAT